MPILLILLNTMSLFCSPSSNDVIVQIEEHDFLEPEEYRFGTHSFGLIYKGNLQELLIYCMVVTNQPVLKEFIQLGKERFIEVKAGARNGASYEAVGREVFNQLKEKFSLEVSISAIEKVSVLKINEINQNPKEALDNNSGGVSFNDSKNIVMNNAKCFNVSYFFIKSKLLITVKEDDFLTQKVSFTFPQKIYKKLPKGKKQLVKWMAKYGIECEIVKEPKRMIVPKK